MGRHFGYTISGPSPGAADLPQTLSKSPSVRREPKVEINHLRDLYQNPVPVADHRASFSSTDHGALGSGTPNLPPTPPTVGEDTVTDADEASSDLVKARLTFATPVNQLSPPTPDITPPREKPTIRPFLIARPSMASTGAESFETAQEELPSDRESVPSVAFSYHDRNRSFPRMAIHSTNAVHKPSPLASLPITNCDLASAESTLMQTSHVDVPDDTGLETAQHAQAAKHPNDSSAPGETSLQEVGGIPEPLQSLPRPRQETLQRGRSLRERLEESRKASHSPSMDKFASIIGWSNDVRSSADGHRRWSGVSNTSTVEAFLIENPRLPKKRNTLRHVSKNESLRSASSPLPNSNRTSMQSSSDSPHRLVHKKAKLNSRTRLSFGSEISQPISMESNAAPKREVIKVAIIPERSSSLLPSTSSRRQSLSTTGAPTSFRMPRQPETAQGKHLTVDAEIDRDRYYPPQVPQRRSSLSAPTSRNTSRANSMTSDHTRFERKKAEKDLRTTLDRMEIERLTSSLKSDSVDIVLPLREPEVGHHDHAQSMAIEVDPYLTFVTPGSKDWTELRPTYSLHTPFSQPSFMSASPEISEARMIRLHPHNNHSVQLIEPFPLHESYAVEEARKLNQSNIQSNHQDYETLDSPLRNPRNPPAPPLFHVIPATPQDELQAQPTSQIQHSLKQSVPQRPVARSRTDSFARNLLRSVSLKNARNKKADQDLDSNLNPFWRPQPFWDGIEPVSPEKKQRDVRGTEHGIVNNSLGLPQQRNIISGPLALVRKLSQRGQKERLIAKQASYSSLHRLRTGRKLYSLPGFGMHIHLITLKDVQAKLNMVRQKKEDEKREKRREALRRSIGVTVIATGDSRFPVTTAGSELTR